MKKRVFLLLMAVALAVVATVFTAPAAVAVDTDLSDKEAWCYACEKDVTWTALPAGWAPSADNNDQHYHFYLTADRAIGNPAWTFKGTSVGSKKPHKVCFHLNGHISWAAAVATLWSSTGAPKCILWTIPVAQAICLRTCPQRPLSTSVCGTHPRWSCIMWMCVSVALKS